MIWWAKLNLLQGWALILLLGFPRGSLAPGISSSNSFIKFSWMWHWVCTIYYTSQIAVDSTLFYKKIRFWLGVTFPLLEFGSAWTEILLRNSLVRSHLRGKRWVSLYLKGMWLEGEKDSASSWAGNQGNRFERCNRSNHFKPTNCNYLS